MVICGLYSALYSPPQSVRHQRQQCKMWERNRVKQMGDHQWQIQMSLTGDSKRLLLICVFSGVVLDTNTSSSWKSFLVCFSLFSSHDPTQYEFRSRLQKSITATQTLQMLLCLVFPRSHTTWTQQQAFFQFEHASEDLSPPGCVFVIRREEKESLYWTLKPSSLMRIMDSGDETGDSWLMSASRSSSGVGQRHGVTRRSTLMFGSCLFCSCREQFRRTSSVCCSLGCVQVLPNATGTDECC